MKRSILLISIIILSLFAAGCATTPTLTPTPTVTPTPTATPIVTAPANITVTLPPGTPSATVTITHYIHGKIAYDQQPSPGYRVLVITDKGNQYSNTTDPSGNFNVTFLSDGSETYKLKLLDSNNNTVYQDTLPRYLNATGPMNINIEVPGTIGTNVTIT